MKRYVYDDSFHDPQKILKRREEMLPSSLLRFRFSCMNVLRYTIEETITKVDHMARDAQSTASDHDLGEAQRLEKLFLKRKRNALRLPWRSSTNISSDTPTAASWHSPVSIGCQRVMQ